MDATAEQESCLRLLHPGRQTVPVQQQRVVRDDQVVVNPGEDPGVHEGLGHGHHLRGQRRDGDPAPQRRRPVDVEQGQEQATCRATFLRCEGIEDRVRLLVQCGPESTCGEVVGRRQRGAGRLLPAAAQRVRQQGQDYSRCRFPVGVDVTQKQLGELGCHGATVPQRRSFDDPDERLLGDRAEHDRGAEVLCEPFVAHREPDGVRPQCEDTDGVLRQPAEPLHRRLLLIGWQLVQVLELVDHEQRRCSGQDEIGDSPGGCLHGAEVAEGTPLRGLPADQTGGEQRRLPGPGFAEQDDDP